MRPPSGTFIQNVVCERDDQSIGPTSRLGGGFVDRSGVRRSHENILITRCLNCGRRGSHEAIPRLSVLRRGERIPEVLNLAQGRLDRLEDCRLQRRVVANELVNSRSNKDSILFVLKNALVSLRGKDRKQARDDGRSRGELVLASLIET